MMPRHFYRTVLFIGLFVLILPCAGFSEELPRLVDVGADKCIPCIKMAPVLDQLREDLTGKLEVVFIDAWKSREEAASFGVKMIPTQIFFAADGRELFRHTGFYGREEILAKWRELGYRFEKDKP